MSYTCLKLRQLQKLLLLFPDYNYNIYNDFRKALHACNSFTALPLSWNEFLHDMSKNPDELYFSRAKFYAA